MVFLFLGQIAVANESDRIKQLEQRIKALEAQNGSTSDSSGLKVRDLGGEKIEQERSISSTSGAGSSLSPEQQAEVMKKLSSFKKRR